MCQLTLARSDTSIMQPGGTFRGRELLLGELRAPLSRAIAQKRVLSKIAHGQHLPRRWSRWKSSKLAKVAGAYRLEVASAYDRKQLGTGAQLKKRRSGRAPADIGCDRLDSPPCAQKGRCNICCTSKAQGQRTVSRSPRCACTVFEHRQLFAPAIAPSARPASARAAW